MALFSPARYDWGMGMTIGLAVVSPLLKSVAVGYIYRTSRRRINKSVASKLPFNQVRPLNVLIFMKHANGARGFFVRSGWFLNPPNSRPWISRLEQELTGVWSLP